MQNHGSDQVYDCSVFALCLVRYFEMLKRREKLYNYSIIMHKYAIRLPFPFFVMKS
jgi:hypothetical protein